MEKYCKNCGAALDKNTEICPDCGREVENSQKHGQNYCPSCGFKIDYDENFCRNCGVQINAPKPVKESFLDKYKTPILIVSVIAIVTVLGLSAFISLDPIGGQVIEVDTISFNIPEEFAFDPDSEINENKAGIHTTSKTWNTTEDYIQIDVIYSTKYDINEIEVLNDLDGEEANLMGYDGIYFETDGLYEFSFVEDSKLCTIYTNNPELFEEIMVNSLNEYL